MIPSTRYEEHRISRIFFLFFFFFFAVSYKWGERERLEKEYISVVCISNRSFVHVFVCLCICSFVRSFVCLLGI